MKMIPKAMHPAVEDQAAQIAAGLADDDRDDYPRREDWDDMVADIECDMG